MSAQAAGGFGRIEARDRNLLIGCGVLVAILIVALAFFSPLHEGDEDPTPLSYSTGKHGAKAAFELLSKAGYKVERQNAPLSEIVDKIDEHTTLVIAEPYMLDVVESRATLKQALDQGARVLVTGPSGAMLVPGNGLDQRNQELQRECEAEPDGFGEIANSGKVRMPAPVHWLRTQPLQSVEYTCDGQAVVVRYASGKGEVIWWANSFPLENVGIQQEDNLALFLNSIGPVSNHVVWDESLHGESRSLWSYSNGTPIYLVWGQLAMVALLLLFSYSRRSGPLRTDPIVSRATPIEFVHSLGSLYQKAGATRVAVAIAYQRFRHKLEKQFDVSQSLTAENPALLEVLTSRFAARAARIQKDLLACENAAGVEDLTGRQALTLVQTLYDDEALINAKAVTK
jgi:Domain of unknown function (DUF4350)